MTATITLPDGETVPALGQGTWLLGEDPSRRAAEIDTLRAGLDLGLTLIDTAEMYGEGAAEELIREAVGDRRDQVFLVSKVYPHNASRAGVVAACERSLRRLGTDRLDLYLLHWPGQYPLAETVAGFEALQQAGKIRHWGVSNFDTRDMTDLLAVDGGDGCATNQILYNVARRGPEFDLLPWLGERSISVMAYSPLDHDRLRDTSTLEAIGRQHAMTAWQVALAWLLNRPQVCAIPKASTVAHVRANRQALDLTLSEDELAALDRAYPPPRRKRPLEML